MDSADWIGQVNHAWYHTVRGGPKRALGKEPQSKQSGRPFITKHTGSAQFKGKGWSL